MQSIWQLTAPEIPSEPFTENESVDTVVVGAGLTGLTTAVLLARAGQRVTVLESRAVGAVTTGNTTGKLSLLQGTTLSGIRKHAGDEMLRAYVEANRAAQEWVLGEFADERFGTERRPAFTVAWDESGRDTLERELDACLTVGVATERADADLPIKTAGALRLDDQAQLQPMLVLAELVRQLRSLGGRVVEQCRVRDVTHTPDGVLVDTAAGFMRAKSCVLATGAPILDRGMFFAKLAPLRSFVAAYALEQGEAPTGMYVSVDAPGRSLRTARGRNGEPLLVVGSESHITGRAGDTAEALRALDAWTAEHFGPARRETWWAAQDYRTHTHLPFAGPLPRGGGNIYAATGYNKWGMTNAVAAALTVSADLLGEQYGWAETLREHRPGLRDAAEAATFNASVGGHLAKGWAGAELRGSFDESALAEGQGTVVREAGKPVGVARVEGKICKVSGVCTHLGGVLNWNAAERSWDCPLHASRFSADGEVLEGPAVSDLARVTAPADQRDSGQ